DDSPVSANVPAARAGNRGCNQMIAGRGSQVRSSRLTAAGISNTKLKSRNKAALLTHRRTASSRISPVVRGRIAIAARVTAIQGPSRCEPGLQRPKHYKKHRDGPEQQAHTQNDTGNVADCRLLRPTHLFNARKAMVHAIEARAAARADHPSATHAHAHARA